MRFISLIILGTVITSSPFYGSALGGIPPGPNSFEYLLGEDFNFRTGASVVFVDYDSASSGDIRTLKLERKYVICYVNVGAYENWRSDKDKFPPEVLGNDYSGWPGEKWLDIRALDALYPIMKARFQQAKDKGCHGIDPDNMNAYVNPTGFPLEGSHQINYNKNISSIAKELGLLVGLKNDGDQAESLVDYFDFVVVEECVSDSLGNGNNDAECQKYSPFVEQKKPFFGIEYTNSWTMRRFRKTVCPVGRKLGISFILKKLDLHNDYVVPCILF